MTKKLTMGSWVNQWIPKDLNYTNIVGHGAHSLKKIIVYVLLYILFFVANSHMLGSKGQVNVLNYN